MSKEPDAPACPRHARHLCEAWTTTPRRLGGLAAREEEG